MSFERDFQDKDLAWSISQHHDGPMVLYAPTVPTMEVDPKYLQAYLDEFVFRFNRRQIPMAAFQTLLGITAAKKPSTMRKIVEGYATG